MDQELHFTKPAEQHFADQNSQEARFEKEIHKLQEPHFVDGNGQAPHVMESASSSKSHFIKPQVSKPKANKEPHYVTSPQKDDVDKQASYEWQTMKNDKYPYTKHMDDVHGYEDNRKNKKTGFYRVISS